MSSRQKRAANRANGAKSHGPKTPEGLKKSSMNALRSGIFAKTIVLTNESPALFNELLQTYVDKFLPTDGVEHDLVDEMVAAKWRQHRLWMIETATLDFAMDAQAPEFAKTFSQIDEPTRLALAHKDAMRQLANIERCEGSYRRQYNHALKNLLQLRKAAAESLIEQGEAPQRNEPTALPEPAPVALPDAQRNEPNVPSQPPISPTNDGANEYDPEFLSRLSPYLREKLLRPDEAA